MAGSFSSQQAAEAEEVGAEGKEQVIELGQSEDEFGAFDQVDLSEDPFGDLGEMGSKRLPPRSKWASRENLLPAFLT